MPPDADHPTIVFGDAHGRRVGELQRTLLDDEIVAARYRIVRFIAAGGMGEVYEAFDLELGVHVAIKTVRAEMASAEALERLRREIHIARRVTHPNVCRTFDIDHHGPVTFVTMEMLAGMTLARHLREQKQLTTDEALPIVTQIAAGLDAAHRAGVIHRDLKSENVMLIGDRVVITDFGLARLTLGGDDAMASMTRPGEIVGTAAYLAPEQCEGRDVSPATDVYALGVVMFEMITGARPFAGDSLLTTVVQKLKEAPSSPRAYVPDLDARWEAAILRCLEREPADRFSTAGEVVDAITGAAPVMTRARRDRRIAAFAAAALVVVAIGGGILQYRATRREMLTPAPAHPTIEIPKRTSIAVLGFRNVAGRSESEWISTALAEMLTTELAAEGRLRTISGEDVQRAKVELALGDASSFSTETLARIRKNLGADLVVFGSFTKIGEDLRVDVRVQDATGGNNESSIAETGTEARLFDVVSRVGTRMRQTLGVQSVASTASTQALGALPASPAAARLYAEGLDKLRGFDALAARDLLERAIAVEPDQPLLHAALANAWSSLGYDKRSKEEAKRAFDLSAKLPREQRLLIEAGYRESVAEWMRATDIYRALTSFFPDNLEYGLHLANAQTRMGNASEALVTTEWLRRLPEPLGSDPRIDLAEMEAAATLADYKRMNAVAMRAIARGEARGARLLVARALSGVGVANHRLGNTTESIAAQERALTIYRDANDRGGAARSLLRIGAVYVYRGEVQRARRYFVDALAIGDDVGDAWLQGAACNNLAYCAFTVGDPRAAETLLGRMLRLARDLGDRKIEATAHDNLGYAYFLRGDLAGANGQFLESVAIAKELKTQQLLAVATSNVGDVLFARGDLAGARREYETGLAIREKIGEKRGVAESRLYLANVALEDGRVDDAERLARMAVEWASQAKIWDVEALARTALARTMLQRKSAADARKEIDFAARLADARENVVVKIAVHATRARILAASDPAEAVRVADATVALAAGDLVAPRLEAMLARAEVAAGAERPRRLAEVAREASARGFVLIATKAKR